MAAYGLSELHILEYNQIPSHIVVYSRLWPHMDQKNQGDFRCLVATIFLMGECTFPWIVALVDWQGPTAPLVVWKTVGLGSATVRHWAPPAIKLTLTVGPC
jgi:hypothetical protein